MRWINTKGKKKNFKKRKGSREKVKKAMATFNYFSHYNSHPLLKALNKKVGGWKKLGLKFFYFSVICV